MLVLSVSISGGMFPDINLQDLAAADGQRTKTYIRDVELPVWAQGGACGCRSWWCWLDREMDRGASENHSDKKIFMIG